MAIAKIEWVKQEMGTENAGKKRFELGKLNQHEKMKSAKVCVTAAEARLAGRRQDANILIVSLNCLVVFIVFNQIAVVRSNFGGGGRAAL